MEGNYAAPHGGIAIILNENLTEDTAVPARRHKKRRIQKKWLSATDTGRRRTETSIKRGTS